MVMVLQCVVHSMQIAKLRVAEKHDCYGVVHWDESCKLSSYT